MHARRPRPTILLTLLLTLALAGCGSDGEPPAETAATPAPAPSPAAAEEAFEPGHSNAVRRYYGDPHTHEEPVSEDGIQLDSEAEYHQPPQPATGEIGDTITLTGTNLGVRMQVTVTGLAPVRRAGERYTAVRLRVVNDGTAIFEAPLTNAVLVDAAGRRARATAGVRAACSRGFDDLLRIDVGEKRAGCVLFPASRARPARLQLALEQVPAAAGGRWFLR